MHESDCLCLLVNTDPCLHLIVSVFYSQVHDSGFGVREEGMPQAQRVLLGEVPAKAVLALLHYIYTGHCPLTPELVPHVQELAIRLVLC